MVLYTLGTARIASLPPWTSCKAAGKALLCCLTYHAFVGLDHKLACIWTRVCDVSFKTILLPLLHLSLGCNNSFCTLMSIGLLVNLYNMWLVCWIMYDLGCMLVESSPFTVLDGLLGLYGLKYDSATACGLPLYLCSYKLVGSATKDSLVNPLKFAKILSRRSSHE